MKKESSSYECFGLAGKNVLVTGSSRGIGRAFAFGLARCGANVAVHCVAENAGARSVVEEVEALGVKSALVPADLSKPGAAAGLFAGVLAAFGSLDILVLNASIEILEDFEEISSEHFDEQVTVNFKSSLELMQLALPAMRQRKWGRVVAVGSVQQALPHPKMVVYAAMKEAQMSMVRNLAKQVASEGVTINNLAPGAIGTDRNRERLQDEAYRRKVLDLIPAGRIGEPEDCVGALLLLCSDMGSYITGQNLYADGGMGL